MKNLYMIGGTMGVGKTTACTLLKRRLDDAVFLDGDWCWDADPFQVTEETKTVVIDNICHVLNNFIHCKAYQNIIFCWVMHQQEIIDRICSRLDTGDCNMKIISLVCDRAALVNRLRQDIGRGIRQPGDIERSCGRISLYEELSTIKIDVSTLTPAETAEQIAAL